jgi:nucleotide-binding universal stress UspA family protein
MDQCTKKNIPNCSVAVVTGAHTPKELVCEFATNNSVSAVFMGTHGANRLTDLVLGSFASYVVHNITSDVTVARK